MEGIPVSMWVALPAFLGVDQLSLVGCVVFLAYYNLKVTSRLGVAFECDLELVWIHFFNFLLKFDSAVSVSSASTVLNGHRVLR